MSARYFLDTNVFIYSLDRSAPSKCSQALKLIREAVDSHDGIISYQVVQEFLSVALRRSEQPMKIADAEQYLFSVLHPLLRVHSSPTLFAEALRVCERNKLSWYDSLIVAAAIQAKCDILYTEDLHHGQQFGSLKVINPFH
jgi:predicted nucleic acid-binding protein